MKTWKWWLVIGAVIIVVGCASGQVTTEQFIQDSQDQISLWDLGIQGADAIIIPFCKEGFVSREDCKNVALAKKVWDNQYTIVSDTILEFQEGKLDKKTVISAINTLAKLSAATLKIIKNNKDKGMRMKALKAPKEGK